MQPVRRLIAGLGLWPRMALGISVGFVVLFVAFSLLGERTLRDSTDRILEERIVIAQMATGQLDAVLQQAIADLEQARRFADFDPDDPNLADEAHLLAHTYGRVGVFTTGITFLDSTGHVVLAHPPGRYAPGTDLSGFPYVRRAVEARRTLISAPFIDPLSKQPVAAVTIPIFAEGRFIGILGGLIDLRGSAIILPLQQAATFGETGHAFLIDSQGRTLASTFDVPFLSPGEHATYYRQVMARRIPTVNSVPTELEEAGEPQKHNHVMAVAPLQTAPWAVAVGGDADETFAGVRQLRTGLALLGAIALLGTWTVTLVGTRRLVGPVQRLTESAQRIANGDLHTPLQAPEGGEIGAMANALDRMRRQLLANITELANLNETLEARVAERTQELEALYAELQEKEARRRELLEKTINAQEDERRRLARELHDELAQALTALTMRLEALEDQIPSDQEPLRKGLMQTRELTVQTLDETRQLILDLRPIMLDDLGLVPAIRWYTETHLESMDVDVTLIRNGDNRRLPAAVETALFRIVQEAVNNIARHAGATQATISLALDDGHVTTTIVDDGIGFDLEEVLEGGDTMRGMGLLGIQERVDLLGGTLAIESVPNRGTRIMVELPIDEEDAAYDN